MPADLSLLKSVSAARIERDVRYLATEFPTRHTFGRYLVPASAWLAAQFRAAGLPTVDFHYYTAEGRQLRSVVAQKPGHTGRTTVLCAHFDSRMRDLYDAKSPAPGADDNGSGVAAVLEIARLLAPVPLSDALRFVLFSGEEEGLWGSTAYARKLRTDRTDVRFVLNLDEIGYPPPDHALFVDRDETHSNDRGSGPLVARMESLARAIGIPTRTDRAQDSDYIPFADSGYVIAGLYEAGKYPSYHTSDDTPEKVDYRYVADATRLALATLLTECA